VATALLVVGWLILVSNDPWSSTSIASTPAIPSTGPLTMHQLRAGDCLQGSGQTLEDFSQGNGPFTGVPCTEPHTAEVVFAGNAWPRSLAYPGDQAVYDHGHARCLTAFSVYDGTGSSSSTFDVVVSTPDSSTWPGGDRRLVCFASSAPGWVDYSIQGLGQ
jgi:Septum formation